MSSHDSSLQMTSVWLTFFPVVAAMTLEIDQVIWDVQKIEPDPGMGPHSYFCSWYSQDTGT